MANPGPTQGFDPRLTVPNENIQCEELYPKEEYQLSSNEIVFFALRCVTLFVCVVSIVIVLVNIARGNRLKSWRLYFLVAMSVFSWIAMALYQDNIDTYFVQEITRFPQPLSIYQCFRNFIHGFTLYLILLLLAHLSDMQHRSHWFGFIAGVIFIPLIYSVGVLIADLRLDPGIVCEETQAIREEDRPIARNDKYVIVAIETVRVLLYNVINTILLFLMSRSFCTSRLYGTYSEKRSKVVVLVARWTYAFLLIHNLVTFAQYAIFIITRLDFYPSHLSILTIIHSAFHEVVFFTIVLCVPISYLIGFAAQSCCGISRGADMEMDKVDKIYTDVWTTPSVRNGNSSSRPGSATPSNTTMTNFNSSSNPAGNGLVTGLQNGVVARRNPGGGSNSTLSSIDSFGDLPRVGTNPGGRNTNPDRRKRVRESYMEAVSTGSLNDDRASMTSDPIDL